MGTNALPWNGAVGWNFAGGMLCRAAPAAGDHRRTLSTSPGTGRR